jgi:hypothetical protein
MIPKLCFRASRFVVRMGTLFTYDRVDIGGDWSRLREVDEEIEGLKRGSSLRDMYHWAFYHRKSIPR